MTQKSNNVYITSFAASVSSLKLGDLYAERDRELVNFSNEGELAKVNGTCSMINDFVRLADIDLIS